MRPSVLVAGFLCIAATHGLALSAQAAGGCMNASEARALACSNGKARRHGDTLIIRLATGERRMINESHGDFLRVYQYAGTVGRGGFHIVTLHFYEGPWQSLLINPMSGREASTLMDIVPSPDGERFVTDKSDWNDCEGDEPGLEVWRLTDSVPVLDWRLKPNSCHT